MLPLQLLKHRTETRNSYKI